MDGYRIDVECDEQSLRVRAKNNAARVALTGEAHGDGAVVIPQSMIADAKFKAASMFVKGKLSVRTTDGHKYRMHFRKKQQGDFERLTRELNGALWQRLDGATTAPSTTPRPSLADRTSGQQASVWDLPGQDEAFGQDVAGEGTPGRPNADRDRGLG
jgi:hypothetical protein